MTEQDKNLIIRLWESGEPSSSIVRLLPYDAQTAKSMIMELRQNGVLKGRSGKTATKTWEKVLRAYNDGITSPYDLAEMFLLKVSTVNNILGSSGLKRQRPKHNYKQRKVCENTKAIITALKSGKRVREICEDFGVSKQYVYEVKNKFVKEQL